MEYTELLLLQHRKHYSQEVFEVAPLEPEVDLFLPFWWIAKHPHQGAWDSEELRSSSRNCLEECMRFVTAEFSLSLDETVTLDPGAKVIGYVSAINEEDPEDQIPKEFRGYLDIISQEVAEALPAHRPYDCKIDLKEGETAPWGPIYPLSENELQTLREWLKEMLRTGKIQGPPHRRDPQFCSYLNQMGGDSGCTSSEEKGLRWQKEKWRQCWNGKPRPH